MVEFFDVRSQHFFHEQRHRGGDGSGIPEMDDHLTGFSIWKRYGEQENERIANTDVVIIIVEVYAKGLLRSFWDAEDGMNRITEVIRCYSIQAVSTRPVAFDPIEVSSRAYQRKECPYLSCNPSLHYP